MIFHLLKEKYVFLVLVFMICSIPAFAFADADKTSRKDIKDSNHFISLGLTNMGLGKNQEAVDALKQAISIKPDNAEAHLVLGNCYGTLGRIQYAVYAFKQAIRIKPDFTMAHHGLGMYYAPTGNKGSARDEHKILKDIDKERENILFNLIYP